MSFVPSAPTAKLFRDLVEAEDETVGLRTLAEILRETVTSAPEPVRSSAEEVVRELESVVGPVSPPQQRDTSVEAPVAQVFTPPEGGAPEASLGQAAITVLRDASVALGSPPAPAWALLIERIATDLLSGACPVAPSTVRRLAREYQAWGGDALDFIAAVREMTSCDTGDRTYAA